VDYQQLYY